MADAFNNLSDAGSSLITLIGFKFAGMKPDKEHPFGHGRIEYISGLAVAAVIIRLNLCTDIRNVMVSSAITETKDELTKKRQYSYTITFDYVPHWDTMDSVTKGYREMLDKEGS